MLGHLSIMSITFMGLTPIFFGKGWILDTYKFVCTGGERVYAATLDALYQA